TSTATDRRRSWGCASIILSPRVRSARTAGALSTWPVHDDNPCKDERCCGRKRRCQRLAQDCVTCQDAEHGRQKCKYRQLAGRIGLNEREPGGEGESHDPDALIKQQADGEQRWRGNDTLAEQTGAKGEHGRRDDELIEQNLFAWRARKRARFDDQR